MRSSYDVNCSSLRPAVTSGFARLAADNATFHATHSRVVRQGMNPAVASTKKSAQHPAHDADQDGAPERASKTVDVKTVHELVHQEEHETVNDEDENPEGENNQWCHEEQKDWTQESVEDTQEQRCADQGRDTVVPDAADERGRDHHGYGRDCPAENEVSHAQSRDFSEPVWWRFFLRKLPCAGTGLADPKQK